MSKLKHEDNPRSIKYYVKQYLLEHKNYYAGKTVVDFPAGNGITSRLIREIGSRPVPLDLFPEYFQIEGLTCKRTKIAEGLPLDDNSVDAVICQEGIEHFSDQLQALKHFNRVIQLGGRLLITAPNYSNVQSRLSYMLMESERFNSIMPPNELDSIWMSAQDVTDEIYYGHIFLIGFQKLRVLARLAGFKVIGVYKTRTKSTSALLLPFYYPFILLTNYITYRRNLKKNENYSLQRKKEVYGEIFRYGISLKILLGSHLMIEFEKEQDAKHVSKSLKSQHIGFDET
jgi:SAM-dependent methyltransferase